MLTETTPLDKPLLDKEQLIRNVQANFPAELHVLPQWVGWCYEHSANRPKPAKAPYGVHGGRARVNDIATWGTFEEACEAFLSGSYDGIGFVFTDETGVTGIDLDNAVIGGKLIPWAYDIMRLFPNTYAEYSVSGKGVHILVRSTEGTIGKRRGNIEVYSGNRFFAVTGNILPHHDAMEVYHAK